MNINKLKGKIVENAMNVEDLANAIGVEKCTMYRKLKKYDKITIGEASKIKDVLNLSADEAVEIFLS